MFNRIGGIKDTVYEEGTHFMVPWFERPIIYDVRPRAAARAPPLPSPCAILGARAWAPRMSRAPCLHTAARAGAAPKPAWSGAA